MFSWEHVNDWKEAGIRGIIALTNRKGEFPGQLHLNWICWPLGCRCLYCGGQRLRVKDPHYRRYWRRYTCLDCGLALGREVTFTDLSGTVLEGSHMSVRAWLWGSLLFVSGCSTRKVVRELDVNYKTARRMVSLF